MIYFFKGCDFWLQLSPIESHERSFVAHLVTVVGSREDCQDFATFLILVPFMLDLMTSHDHLQVIIIKESLGDIWTKLDSHSSLARVSAVLVRWIRP